VSVEGRAVLSPGLALVLAPPAEPCLEPGWVSPEYGIRLEAPVVSVAAAGCDAAFVTLVAPHRVGEPVPALSLQRSESVTCATVTRGDTCDLVRWDGTEAGWSRVPHSAAST